MEELEHRLPVAGVGAQVAGEQAALGIKESVQRLVGGPDLGRKRPVRVFDGRERPPELLDERASAVGGVCDVQTEEGNFWMGLSEFCDGDRLAPAGSSP